MAGFDDIRKQAAQILGNDKVRDALNSKQAEDVSDRVLDGVEGAANKVTGNRFGSQVGGARDKADGLFGDDEKHAPHTGTRDRDVDEQEGRGKH
jgi:hypothetical protein